MEWLEQNLDAYRIIAEILKDLREVLRSELERQHGKRWYETGLPDGLLDRLIDIKEKEKAIDWYESEYQQIISYAVFPDLLQILERNADQFPHIMHLAPTTALLHARFLELEVMRSKLGRARPISETELAFLGTFHLRFRKAIDDFRTSSPAERAAATQQSPAPMPPPPTPAPPASTRSAPAPQLDDTTDAELLQEEALEQEQVIQEPPVQAPSKKQAARKPPERSTQVPGDVVAEESEPDTGSATSEPETIDEVAEDTISEEVSDTAEAKPPGPTIENALESGDHKFILRALYQEITNTAEGIWTKDVLPMRRVWDKVSTSNWYEQNFSQLGLKPVSDFYEIMSKVDSQMREGASKADLQDYLKQSNFARVLLALRDMFQGHRI